MKYISLFLVGFLLFGTIAYANSDNKTAPKKMLRHAVLFKFKDTATPAQVKEVEDAFRKLPSKVKEVKGFEWGTNNSPEGLNQGFTHIFFVSFDSEEGRAAYLPHPEHKAFVKVLEPHLDKVLVIDYWTQE
ncbi:Dabb family protein [Dyadobacter frigoris]|uniref:Dabb family protein n=1 Tax=Dyadobacter frigoris TaxID=2576211 RepID=A0A4U6CLG2_9BACT|nr:Dabb family protein [Dyadobacter frigoris]TKT85100.1 Dabb family protein [Dyadobacter frigoris]GLU57305.1 stress responsive protein [Dyadobacter frigoris]